MNIYRNCLLILAVFLTTGIFNVSAIANTSDTQASTFKPSASGRWVASDKFVKKNTVCYREYICRANGSARFGRNLRIEGKKLQRGRSVCSGPENTCQCKTAPPTLRCDVKFLKRR